MTDLYSLLLFIELPEKKEKIAKKHFIFQGKVCYNIHSDISKSF